MRVPKMRQVEDGSGWVGWKFPCRLVPILKRSPSTRAAPSEPGCPVCGGPTTYVLLIGSEELVCADPECPWEGAVIATLEDD